MMTPIHACNYSVNVWWLISTCNYSVNEVWWLISTCNYSVNVWWLISTCNYSVNEVWWLTHIPTCNYYVNVSFFSVVETNVAYLKPVNASSVFITGGIETGDRLIPEFAVDGNLNRYFLNCFHSAFNQSIYLHFYTNLFWLKHR